MPITCVQNCIPLDPWSGSLRLETHAMAWRQEYHRMRLLKMNHALLDDQPFLRRRLEDSNLDQLTQEEIENSDV